MSSTPFLCAIVRCTTSNDFLRGKEYQSNSSFQVFAPQQRGQVLKEVHGVEKRNAVSSVIASSGGEHAGKTISAYFSTHGVEIESEKDNFKWMTKRLGSQSITRR